MLRQNLGCRINKKDGLALNIGFVNLEGILNYYRSFRTLVHRPHTTLKKIGG